MTAPAGIDPGPGPRQYLGYAAGEVANNLTFQTVSMFLLLYYTDIAGIPAAAAGTIFLVVRLWGGFTDLLAGRRADRTTSRWGRFRPYLLVGPAPLLVLFVVMFSIPGDQAEGVKLAWAVASYGLFSLAYSFVNIPYGSLAAAMTQEPDARAKFSSSRAVSASLTILVIAAAIAPQLDSARDLQRSLTNTAVVFAAVALVLYLACFATSRERVQRNSGEVGLRDTATMIRDNRPLLLLCASALLYLTGVFSTSTVAVYYARDVLGDARLYVVMTVVQTVAMVAAAIAVPGIVRTVGKKHGYLLAGVVGAAGAAGLALAPSAAPAIGIACYAVLGLGLGVINTLIFALQPDTVDYGEWRTGVRAEGGSYAVLSFTRKAGQAIGGAAAAFTLGLGGYVSGAAQSDAALTSIRVAAGIVPALGVAAAVAIMLAYPLTEARLRHLVGELAAHHAALRDELVPDARGLFRGTT